MKEVFSGFLQQSLTDKQEVLASPATYPVQTDKASPDHPPCNATSTPSSDTGIATESSFDLVAAKNSYKEFISITKDTLDVTWKAAPASLFPASMFLWVYLKALHWTDIYQSALLSGSGLIFVFGVALLMSIAVLLQFLSPSIFSLLGIGLYRKDKLVPKATVRLLKSAMAGWFCALSIAIILNKYSVPLIFLITFIPPGIYAFMRSESIYPIDKSSTWKGTPLLLSLVLAAIFSVAMFFTSLPLLISIHAAAHYATGGAVDKVLAIAICMSTSFVSLLPGYFTFNSRTYSTSTYRSIKFALLGSFLISYAVWAAASFWAPISASVLEGAEIFSNEVKTYQVTKAEVIPALIELNFPVAKKKDLTLVNVYLRFIFGDMRLACTDKLDLNALASKTLQNDSHVIQDHLGFEAGSGCILLYTSEIRPLRPKGNLPK